jgi:hypothetical protein
MKPEENKEVEDYLKIFRGQNFREHWEVNVWISSMNKWDDFKNIRSINDHERAKNLQGIQPRFFAEVCQRLKLEDFNGSKLIKAVKY